MSAIYRCDLCGLEVPHPRMDTEQECILLPDGWRSDGDARDFCPNHSLRIKDNEFVRFDLAPDGEYGPSAQEWGNVVSYDEAQREYEVKCFVDGIDANFYVPADHLEQENPSVYWVPK